MQNPDLIGTVHDFLISKKLARGFLVIEIPAWIIHENHC